MSQSDSPEPVQVEASRSMRGSTAFIDVYHLLSDSVGEQRHSTSGALRYMLEAAEELVKQGRVVTMWKTGELKETDSQ